MTTIDKELDSLYQEEKSLRDHLERETTYYKKLSDLEADSQDTFGNLLQDIRFLEAENLSQSSQESLSEYQVLLLRFQRQFSSDIDESLSKSKKKERELEDSLSDLVSRRKVLEIKQLDKRKESTDGNKDGSGELY